MKIVLIEGEGLNKKGDTRSIGEVEAFAGVTIPLGNIFTLIYNKNLTKLVIIIQP